MFHRTLALAAAAVLAFPLAARAAAEVPMYAVVSPGAPGHWSVITGETAVPGHDFVSAELGFPGFTFGYTHGFNEWFDAGVKVDLLYGFRNTTLSSQFGMQMRIPLRYMIYRRGVIGVQLHIDPGLDFYTAPRGGSTNYAIGLPVGAAIGFQVTPELRLALTGDLPISVIYTPSPVYLQTGPLFGGAVEYFFERQWSAGLNLRFGPQFFTQSSVGTQLGFLTELIIGYRL
ncbi:MAG TPA: hypothetical protein VN874_02410 [Myxococcales bacterium]|jgi:hypothetical protein|nr:hypothetical protein [Myxococcales bacterium]